MSQSWASQLPTAVSLPELLDTATQLPPGGAICVFAPDDTVPTQDRRGYAALVIAYSRFEEPVAILDDGSTALLLREGGVSAAEAVATRMLTQASRMGVHARLRVGVAAVAGSPEEALRTARANAVAGRPGEIAGAA